jgi:flagellar biosynthesis regulator FlaF
LIQGGTVQNPNPSAPSANESERDREYRLLALVTKKLTDSKEIVTQLDPQSVGQVCDAIFHNRDVWNAFVTDVADEKNKLPKELKVLLINLAAYVNKNSDMIINNHADGDLDMLIAINRHVMDGLRGAGVE